MQYKRDDNFFMTRLMNQARLSKAEIKELGGPAKYYRMMKSQMGVRIPVIVNEKEDNGN